MKKSLIIVTLLLVSLCGFSQVNRAPKKISLPHNSGVVQGSYKVAQLGTGETISLVDDVDYLQATYYTSGGKHYYTYLLQNYDTELPSLTLETEAESKTLINGSHTVMLDFSSLDIEKDGDTETLTLSSATLKFSFVRYDEGGFSEYDVEITAAASDGNTYTYNSTIVVNAFDADDSYSEIILEDGKPTVVDAVTATTHQPTKFVENGRVLIKSGNLLYDMNGKKVK